MEIYELFKVIIGEEYKPSKIKIFVYGFMNQTIHIVLSHFGAKPMELLLAQYFKVKSLQLMEFIPFNVSIIELDGLYRNTGQY